MSAKTVSVVTHNDPSVTRDALSQLLALCRQREIVACSDSDEISRHGNPEGLIEMGQATGPIDLCICLGGDGTILRGLRANARTETPVFGVNFGEVGFLAASEPAEEGLAAGLNRALDGVWETIDLPALAIGEAPDAPLAFNDIALQRRPGLRVADIAYAIGPDEIGRVRCDGVVVCTPAGSTGYNLANGGPVMAWGVAGFTVSFIAPHSLTARALVVAPADPAMLHNRSAREPVDVALDGRPFGELEPGGQLLVRFERAAAKLAQTEGANFYHRLREKFGRLAT